MRKSIIFILIFPLFLNAQSIGVFNSIQPTSQTQQLILPSTHTFQRIIKSSDALSLGGTLGNNLDFTGYVPISGSSTNGYLSISSETTPAECAILNVNFNSVTKLWNTTSAGKVNFPIADIGGTSRFCSGTVTPNNTIMVSEESLTAGDANGDGYEDVGWLIEIDPASRTVINQDGVGGVDKLWAIGRQSHENCVLTSNSSVVYWGADANPTGYMYKFIPPVAGVFTSGNLYVLKTTAALGTGTWEQVSNTTIANRNNVPSSSTSLMAYNFNGIEDVEIAPDGKVYFAAKGPGRVYRFTDNGSTVSGLEVFVENTNYDVDGAGPFSAESWGVGNDNLAFDGDGNLWVLQDGGRNHIWVVAPTHTATTPSVKLFATTPAGSEPTGITFTPDFKYLFISFQHPSTGNTLSAIDASSQNVVFNTHTTIVIARKENLGLSTLPITLNSFSVSQNNNSNILYWSIEYSPNFKSCVIEKSIDGQNYVPIITFVNNNSNFRYEDFNINSVAYYRIKIEELNGIVSFSNVKKTNPLQSYFIKPIVTDKTLTILITSQIENKGTIAINLINGKQILKQAISIKKGENLFTIPRFNLTNTYILIETIINNTKKVKKVFVH